MDELVQCDSCGFFAHEGCYGISDTDSKLTSTSSASTEPWFCNSCLVDDERIEPKIEKNNAANANNGTNTIKCFTRSCQLCPNVECGLLKETENGRFENLDHSLLYSVLNIPKTFDYSSTNYIGRHFRFVKNNYCLAF